MNPSALSLKPPKSLLEKKQNTTHDCIIVPLPEPFTIIPQQKYTSGNWSLWNRIFYTFMYSIYTANSFFWGGRGRGGCQKLKRLIKSWGDRDVVQLSGLLAVHGWFVSCGEEKQNTRAPIKIPMCSPCLSLKFRLQLFDQVEKQTRSPSRKGCGSVCRDAACRRTALGEDNSGSAWNTSSSTPGDPCRTPSNASGSERRDAN